MTKAGAEQKVLGGDDLLSAQGMPGRRKVRHYPVLPEGGCQAGLCPSRVFPLLIDDEGGVTKGSVADG
jgi:hypothetical protein